MSPLGFDFTIARFPKVSFFAKDILPYTLSNIIIALDCVPSHAVLAYHSIHSTDISTVIVKLFVKNSLSHYRLLYE